MGRNLQWTPKVAKVKHGTYEDHIQARNREYALGSRKADLYAMLAEAVRNTAALDTPAQVVIQEPDDK